MLKSTIQRIQKHKSPYEEQTWLAIEKKLDQKKKNRLILILFFISSLLLTSIYMYHKNYSKEVKEIQEFIPTP